MGSMHALLFTTGMHCKFEVFKIMNGCENSDKIFLIVELEDTKQVIMCIIKC